MWERALERFLNSLIAEGRLDLTLPSGRRRVFGDHGPALAIRITDPGLPRRLCMDPDLALGEGYMEGGLTIAGDDLHGLFRLIGDNVYRNRLLPAWQAPISRLRNALRRLTMINPAARSRANVAHHYDLSAGLYDTFLDADRQYSCAYWPEGVETLEEAQAAKKAHIARKLLLSPGMRVLDIGCGWGGMALTLARDHGARVLGVTLSEEQLKIAQARAAAAGLTDRVEFRLMDYREVQGPFDRIVSVGMFEHVGVPQYRTYFDKVAQLLTPDGVALIHTIAQNAQPQVASSWIRKYIFPGGYTPALSETAPRIEAADLWIADIEVWRGHYARTLAVWHDRFMANRDRLPAEFDARFIRMWRFYLLSMQMAFSRGRLVVHQYQLSRRMDAVPATRDYLYPPAAGPALRAAE